MDIYLIRHGECDLNRRYIGSGTDIPLLPSGREEIKQLSEKLLEDGIPKSVHIYSSSLRRATESSDIFCRITGLEHPVIDKKLNEIHFGIFENLTYDEIMTSYATMATKWYDDVFSVTPDGGEPFNKFVNRVKSFWFQLITEQPEDSAVIIFTHGGVIQLLRCLFHGDNLENRWRYNIKRGEFVKLSL